MLELGAYWGHYSMWMQKVLPASAVYLVEPETRSIAVGKHNFAINGYHGTFIQDFVGTSHFTVDRFLENKGLPRLDVLHSDIEGFEMEMLDGADEALGRRRIEYVFVSTHSDRLHNAIRERLESRGYVTEAVCDWGRETCSHDGLVFARAPNASPVVPTLHPFGRLQLLQMDPATTLTALQQSLGGR